MSTPIDVVLTLALISWVGVLLWFGVDVIIGYAKGHRFEDENEEVFDDEQGNTTE